MRFLWSFRTGEVFSWSQRGSWGINTRDSFNHEGEKLISQMFLLKRMKHYVIVFFLCTSSPYHQYAAWGALSSAAAQLCGWQTCCSFLSNGNVYVFSVLRWLAVRAGCPWCTCGDIQEKRFVSVMSMKFFVGVRQYCWYFDTDTVADIKLNDVFTINQSGGIWCPVLSEWFS